MIAQIERLFSMCFRSNVDHDHAAFVGIFIGDSLDSDNCFRPMLGCCQNDLAPQLSFVDQDVGKKVIEAGQKGRGDGCGKAAAPILRTLDAEQDGTGQVELENDALGIQSSPSPTDTRSAQTRWD